MRIRASVFDRLQRPLCVAKPAGAKRDHCDGPVGVGASEPKIKRLHVTQKEF
jgi:hypothetical protein